jgi:hypothetical protein
MMMHADDDKNDGDGDDDAIGDDDDTASVDHDVTSQHILYYCTYYSVSLTCTVHCTYYTYCTLYI